MRADGLGEWSARRRGSFGLRGRRWTDADILGLLTEAVGWAWSRVPAWYAVVSRACFLIVIT